MQLRRIALSHSLHLTKPMSDKEVRGWQAKIFMSRAVSHAVGGEASRASSFDEIVGEGLSHEKGDGELLRDLRRREAMMVIVQGKPLQVAIKRHSTSRASGVNCVYGTG